jgi:DNA gyrase/topoisomerase IV subunit A
MDERAIGNITAKKKGAEPPVHAVAATSDGYALRFSLAPFVEPFTRAGRRFARVPEKAQVVGVERYTGDEVLIAATRQARAILTKAEEVNFLSGSGRGGKGRELLQRGQFTRVVYPIPDAPQGLGSERSNSQPSGPLAAGSAPFRAKLAHAGGSGGRGTVGPRCPGNRTRDHHDRLAKDSGRR